MAYSEIKNVFISGISSAVPDNIINLQTNMKYFSNCGFDENNNKSGIRKRHVAFEGQTACDLGFIAAKAIIDKKEMNTNEIQLLIFISRTPDYRTPPTSAVLQHRLKLSKDCLVYDINLGGTGFIYGLQVGCSLLENMPIRYGLIIIGDTASKMTSENNFNHFMLGDGASAILIEKNSLSKTINILSEVDHKKFSSYFLRQGGFRIPGANIVDINNKPGEKKLFIDEEVFYSWAIFHIPCLIQEYFKINHTSYSDYNIIAFQHEREDVIKTISEKAGIPEKKILLNSEYYGNAGGASVPILLSEFFNNKKDRDARVLACSFGEGFSVGIADFYIKSSNIIPIIKTDNVFTDGSVSHLI